MNLGKTIKELSNRLDTVYPFSSSSSNEIRHDGINYWKGKKIISVKDWNELYEKSSTYTNDYATTLTSRKPLLYFPDDHNGSISVIGVVDEKLKEEIQKWNKDYYELLEYRKNPVLGRMKCSNCLLSGSNDDPIFFGIEKIFSKIVTNQYNNNNVNTQYHENITYHCNVMNIFSCPFESIQKSDDNNKDALKYPYTKEDLFVLQRIAFAIEQAITTFSEITKNNEIIFEVDFENDRVQEIHTNYYGESESWGWQKNVNEQLLSKVKPISNIVIRDEQDIYNILTSGEKLESLFQEYEKKHQLEKNKQELENAIYNKNLKLKLTIQLKEELKKHEEEQLRLLKENKQTIVKFLLENKDFIIMEDLKAYEPIYECYREKGQCIYCNTTTNIICKNCSNYNYNNNKEIWLCINHWQQHAIENH
jgi:hypothetical protein